MIKPIALVAGYLVRYPLGGHILSQLHFLVGLKRLGYQVVFVEEFGWQDSCYDPRTNTNTNNFGPGVAAIGPVLAQIGLTRWCYVDDGGNYHGLSRDELSRICHDAEFLLSMAGATWLEEFRNCDMRIFFDMDPGFTQFRMSELTTPSRSGYASPYDFQFHFTIGERIGQSDCPIPTHGLRWRPTRWPIALELLPAQFTPLAKYFTTVMSWSPRKPILYKGELYGQKDIEFLRLIDLPQRIGPVFEIALAGAHAPREKIAAAGWKIIEPREVTATIQMYRDYIAQSRGEFGVAVNLEVKARSGWFGDRSAAYLASGKPVIIQDTGFSESLPCGEGLFAFQDEAGVCHAVETISKDYRRHCEAARRVAEEYFEADKVLGEILNACGLPTITSSTRRV